MKEFLNIQFFPIIIRDASTKQFISPQVVTIAIEVVAKSITLSWINITAESLRRFDVQDSGFTACVQHPLASHSGTWRPQPCHIRAAKESGEGKEGRMEQGILTANTCLFYVRVWGWRGMHSEQCTIMYRANIDSKDISVCLAPSASYVWPPPSLPGNDFRHYFKSRWCLSIAIHT